MRTSTDEESVDMGNHVLLNLYGCEDIERLRGLYDFEIWSTTLLKECGAVIVNTSGYQFDPVDTAGYTFFALLTTSHFSIHTWPEHGSAAIDVFTCGKLVDTDRVVAEVTNYFRAACYVTKNVLR